MIENFLSVSPEIQPKIFLMYIVDTITYYKHKKGYYDNKIYQCEYCKSESHHPRNCSRKKEINLGKNMIMKKFLQEISNNNSNTNTVNYRYNNDQALNNTLKIQKTKT